MNIFIIMNRYQKAALISSKNIRNRSLEEYYKDPKICKCCGEIITVKEKQKVSEVKRKIFCNKTCSVRHNNKFRQNKNDKVKKEYTEKYSYLNGVTKKKFFEIKGIYYKFRAEIRKHAQWIYKKNNGEQNCKICGYNKHIQVCHIKSVSSFDDDSLITEINSFENLVGLCPNHHWEYDNGFLVI